MTLKLSAAHAQCTGWVESAHPTQNHKQFPPLLSPPHLQRVVGIHPAALQGRLHVGQLLLGGRNLGVVCFSSVRFRQDVQHLLVLCRAGRGRRGLSENCWRLSGRAGTSACDRCTPGTGRSRSLYPSHAAAVCPDTSHGTRPLSSHLSLPSCKALKAHPQMTGHPRWRPRAA